MSNWLSVFKHGTSEDEIVGIPKFLSLHVIRCSLQGKLRCPKEISRKKTIFSVTHLLLKPGSEDSLNFHFLNYRRLLEPRPCVQVKRTRDLSRGKLSYFAHSVCALSRHWGNAQQQDHWRVAYKLDIICKKTKFKLSLKKWPSGQKGRTFSFLNTSILNKNRCLLGTYSKIELKSCLEDYSLIRVSQEIDALTVATCLSVSFGKWNSWLLTKTLPTLVNLEFENWHFENFLVGGNCEIDALAVNTLFSSISLATPLYSTLYLT